jgi:tetratricopeptide (TPR) repeat protein
MCGGDIKTTDNAYGTCDSCGSTMTLPKASDDRKANLFNRANHFRRQNDFDKAVQAYENILNEDNADAEAHWGVVLSRYGIEYVEDPATGKRVPTCHRVQSESILKDADYTATLEHAPDEYTRSLYEEEAKIISDIQKGILAISNKEKPYDVFICYKEATDGGSRTKDSTIAQDIFYELTKEGYRVFFARITLEDKLGREYEPYIFSALNSAKIMLVIGTRKEYFEATWVKNEWSRFLAIMKKDRSRLLIPCYRDMDAYDMPDELSHLQCQDMSKVGFIQDILRGIKKILDAGKSEEKASSSGAGTTAAPVTPGIESLMKRGKLFLEDSDWKQADDYFNKVLDIDPEYAPAYAGKLCAELKVQREELLGDYKEPVSVNGNFQKAVRFSNSDYKTKLQEYDQKIKKRIAEGIRQEQERLKQEQYNHLVQEKSRASTESKYQDLAKQFRGMNGYKNTIELAIECDKQFIILKEKREEQERLEQEQRLAEEKKIKEEQEHQEFEGKKRAVKMLLVTFVIIVTAIVIKIINQ